MANTEHKPAAQRWLWFLGLWLAGVVVVGAAAALLRLLMNVLL